MPFDLNTLMQNPLFQSGLATLGGAGHPGMLAAYNALQARKKMELEQQQQASQMALEQEKAKQYATQNEIARMNAQRQQKMMEMGERAMQQLMEQPEGDRGVLAAPVQPQQPALAAPPEPVGKYGTPARILDNLEQTESGGNPFALGPFLPSGKRAKGAYQFLDDTRDMLVAQGFPKFDVFNKAQSRDAADFYIQQLTKQHGSLEAALGIYGGHTTTSPTRSAYIGKILGSPEKQAAQSAQQSALAAQSAKYKKAQQLAGAMQLASGDAAGFKGIAEGLKPDYESERIRLQQESDRRAAEELRLRQQKAIQETEKHAEEKANPKLTEQEAKATTYTRQMQDANANLERLTKEGWDFENFKSQFNVAIAGGGLTNIFASEKAQQVKQAQEQWAEAFLRFKTGQATNADEIARNVRTFFPQIGDQKKVIEQKRSARLDAQKAMSIAAGKGMQKLENLGPPSSTASPIHVYSDSEKERRYQEWKARQSK